jgi:hypothetical protein
MNVEINPSGAVRSDSIALSPGTDGATLEETTVHHGQPHDAVELDAIPAVPPPEVMDAISVAARAPDRLAADGKELRFTLDRPTGKVRVELYDLEGNLIREVPASTALDVAAGADLDW